MTAIRCAHCRDRHASVAAVRLCAEREKRIADRARQFAQLPPTAPRVGSDYVTLARTEERQREQAEIARVARAMDANVAAALHHCEDFDGECCQPLTVAQMLDLAQSARDRA